MKEYDVGGIKKYPFPYTGAQGAVEPGTFKGDCTYFITKSNPTCYVNVILPDGTLIQIPYEC